MAAVSRRNRRGILWLILIVLLVSIIPRLILNISSQDEFIVSFQELQEREAELKAEEPNRVQHRSKRKSSVKYKIPDSKFDPNNLTKSDWEKMGLSSKQAEVIVRFTSYGLKSNADLKRIFVLPESLFELIKDSTIYPQLASEAREDKTPETKKLLIELNRASSEDLQDIPGIGPYFGDKIVSYRDKLGGFYSKEQLKEVYRIDDEKYESIAPYLFVDPNEINRIKINSVNIETLKVHPYLNYNQANSIIKIREQHGNFAEIEDIQRSKLIDEELFHKLKPYLIIDK